MIYGDTLTCGCMYGWLGGWVGWWVGSGKNTKNQINLALIELFQFCMKIYDLWRYFHTHTTHWSQSLVIEIMSIVHSPTVWLFDMLLILEILLTFWHLTSYLNHLSPLQGYFYVIQCCVLNQNKCTKMTFTVIQHQRRLIALALFLIQLNFNDNGYIQ